VDVLTGIVGSDVALAVRPFAEANRVPVVIANAGANALTGENCSPWMFRVSFSHAQLVSNFGAWLVKRGIRRVYALGADFVSPREMVEAFRKGFVAAGGTMVGEAFAPYGTTKDYGPYLSQARAANPDAIFAVFYGAEAILFVKQYQSFGMRDKHRLVTTMGLTPQMLRKAQGDAAAGILESLNYVPELDTPANKAFQANLPKKYSALGAGIRGDGALTRCASSSRR
jgi:branched-chain amino acid transport system substrate-binding protein